MLSRFVVRLKRWWADKVSPAFLHFRSGPTKTRWRGGGHEAKGRRRSLASDAMLRYIGYAAEAVQAQVNKQNDTTDGSRSP